MKIINYFLENENILSERERELFFYLRIKEINFDYIPMHREYFFNFCYSLLQLLKQLSNRLLFPQFIKI